MPQPEHAARPGRRKRRLHAVAHAVKGLGVAAAQDDGDGAAGDVARADGAAGGCGCLALEDGGDLGDAGFRGEGEVDDFCCSGGLVYVQYCTIA